MIKAYYKGIKQGISISQEEGFMGTKGGFLRGGSSGRIRQVGNFGEDRFLFGKSVTQRRSVPDPFPLRRTRLRIGPIRRDHKNV